MTPEEIHDAKIALENVQCDVSTNIEICHLGIFFLFLLNVCDLSKNNFLIFVPLALPT